MTDIEASTSAASYDVIIIGAGICGVIFLTYALHRGLRCTALERQEAVGGLWNRLPQWQDIQNRRQDFAIDDVPLRGVQRSDIVDYVNEWVRRFGLQPSLRLGCEVRSVARSGDFWNVQTTEGVLRARYLLVASGLQNRACIPEVERDDATVVERHSSQLERPEDLRGRMVTVVGGGASAFDLLDLALANGAEHIDWVYRDPKWFIPTAGDKQQVWPNLRELALIQTMVRSPATLSAFLQGLLDEEYDYFGLNEIKPEKPFDIRRHQLIPGRYRMIRDLDQISQHRGELRLVEADHVVLNNGDRIDTDMLLWGTGYQLDLTYLDLGEFRDVRTLGALLPKLGSLVRSIHYPSLFFIGMTLIESTSSTPFLAAVEARSIVSHILGETEIPTTNVPHQITHWHLLQHFATFDHANFPPSRWQRLHQALLAGRYAASRNKSIDINDLYHAK